MKNSLFRESLFGIFLCTAFATGLYADTETDEQKDDEQSDEIEEIVVRAHPLSAQSSVGDVLVVSDTQGDAKAILPGNLGQTVENIPGIRNAHFGEGVGQVMIQGLDGPRVMYLYDRLQTMDAALSSSDHPPMMEPIIADHIEVLKGPSTLLFGSGSSGGVINIESGRIPRDLATDYPEYKLWVLARDNSALNAGAFRINTNTDQIAFHADYFFRSSDAYDIPGCAESEYLHALEEEEYGHLEDEKEADHDHDDDHDELADENCGTLIDSDIELNHGGALGLSFIGDWGYTGASISTIRSTMGIPIEHHHEDHEHEDEHEDDHFEMHDEDEHDEDEHESEERERVYIDLFQNRLDWELMLIEPVGFLKDVEVRFATSEYEHHEIAGEITETTYRRDNTGDVRIVATTKSKGSWTHAIGFQRTADDFTFASLSNTGDPTTTTKTGVFWIGNLEAGATNYQFGLRQDTNNLKNQHYGEFDFQLLSASSAATHRFSNDVALRATLDYSSRAPLAEELFVEGSHLFTGSSLIPNLSLSEENMIATSATLSYDLERWSFVLTGYYRSIENYIHESPTGAIEDGLPVYQYVEHDTTFLGADVHLEYELFTSPNWEINTTLNWDTVNGEIQNGPSRFLPRNPSNRFLWGLEFLSGRFWGRVEFEHNDEVTDVPDHILPTDAYSDVSVDLEYEIVHSDIHAAIAIRIKNLFDEEQRPHTSAIKDLAPLPGRAIELGFTLFN